VGDEGWISKGHLRMGTTIAIAELVGARTRMLRRERGLKQEELGRLVAQDLGRPWPKQTVSAIEQGRRECSAAELVALARALGAPVARFLETENEEQPVRLPSGEQVNGRELLDAVVGQTDAAAAFTIRDMSELIGELRGKLAKLQRITKRGEER
jgi:transcriptional regulator with XRE-family HTH domain